MIKVYVGTPTTGSIVDSQSYLLRDLAEKYKDKLELVYPSQCIRRMFHDFARNKVVEDFLSTDCDILWFLDSDITPSLDVLDLIVVDGAKWKVAGATYPVFMQPPGSDCLEVVYTCYKQGDVGLKPAPVPREGKEFVAGLATGCLFIKREVFSELSEPYFEFKYNPTTREMTEGEDLGFVRKLLDKGIETYTDYSLVCKHQKEVDLLDVNNYAIQYSNRNVLAYDTTIRESITQAIEAARLEGFKDGMKAASAALKGADKKSPTLWLPPSI